ncbi:MAG: diaminopimelate epimerase [Pseudomonadota bacterium]
MSDQSAITFSKLEALGNDFMLVDRRERHSEWPTDRIRALGHRTTGVGFDQLLLLDTAAEQADECEARLSIFNQDGSPAEQCGNGLRAIALWLDRRNTLGSGVWLHTPAGLSRVSRIDQEQFAATLPGLSIDSARTLPQLPTGSLSADLIELGNLHLVIHWPTPPSARALSEVAQFIEAQDGWQQRCNIGLAHRPSMLNTTAPDCMDLRVYERGAGATHACGSGACAAAVSMKLTHHTEADITVRQPGGSVVVHWQRKQDFVTLTGPARFIFEGQLA